MESPESWDLLTSSLAVCDLQKPAAVWAFLAVQGLVHDLPADRIAFFKIIRKIRTKSPSTGASRAHRIARRLRLKGMTLPASEAPDPNGEIALGRRQLMEMWTKSFVQTGEKPQKDWVTAMPPVAVQKMYTLCNYCYNVYDLSEEHVCPERREAEQTCQRPTKNLCSHCNTENRLDARYCRCCGNPTHDSLSSLTFPTIVARPIRERDNPFCDSQDSSSAQETDGCFFDILNIIRELKTTNDLEKKSRKR